MISFAEEADMPEVYQNWEASFGDTKEEIDSFFKAFAGTVRVLIATKAGHVAGQLCLLPVKLYFPECDGRQAVDAAYIYAVATATQYRRQGICTELLEELKKLLCKEGLCGVLVPAGKELEVFYEKRGFRLLFHEERIKVSEGVQEGSVTGIKESTIHAYIECRDREFGGKCRIKEPEGMAEYAIKTFLKEGGQCLEFFYKEKRYGILFRREGEIREITAGDAKEAVTVAKAFLKAAGRREGILQRSFCTYGIHLPEGMEKNGYFGLVLE